MFKKSIITLVSLCFVSISLPSIACEKVPYKVGVQSIDYSPHYNGEHPNKETFFKLFIAWVSNKTGCKFEVINLPIKRLYLEFESDSFDLMYPDNPAWHSNSSSDEQTAPLDTRLYSPKIATALGGTMVKPEHENIKLESFRVLVFPRGFSPIAWYPLQESHAIEFKEVTDAAAALMMVDAGRATGADIEYNVARHLAKEHHYTALVLAKNLPFTPTGFHLSTIKHPKLMATISQLIDEHPQELSAMRKKAGLIENLPE
ncbi:hypothetical protein [Thalassotalea marina]|uniref:Solute-binding protein family 3/N-terminal domain-containing protein n=1 Tax=Thalassotalea marina TaxID=1673741 RepID=A0A919BIL5_9GAMM|nr:hypothetical protein [Thalassotalea marina]GHF94322.1 hypothetical protein GCM10017161_23200 [Thalassotalea marina]